MKRLGLEVRIAILPYDKDPDEADQIEVYNAWKDAFVLTTMTLTRYSVHNPYTEHKKRLTGSRARNT